MGRKGYKVYLRDPQIDIKRRLPRQTRFSIKKRKQADIDEECSGTGPVPKPTSFTECPPATAQDTLPVDAYISSSEPDLECEETDDVGSQSSDIGETNEAGNHENSFVFSDEADAEDHVHPTLSVREGCLLVFAYILKHRISNEGMQDLLELIKFFQPSCPTFPSSPYLLKKKLKIDYSAITYNYYCSICKNPIPEDSSSCTTCEEIESNSKRLASYFITFDVQKSLEDLLKLDEVAENLQKNITKRNNTSQNSSYSEEIYDGQKYKSLALKGEDFTCTGNSDGVPCYKSSKFSIWPFLVSVNELSYQLRRKHTFVAALWFGNEKPTFRTFLTPIVTMLNQVSTHGVIWQNGGNVYHSRVFFPIIAADSVARCMLQGINQYNGHFGCPWCYERGETFWESEASHKWVYPSHAAAIRTRDTFLDDLKDFRRELQQNSSLRSRKGIKEASPLILLSQFDIVSGFVFDYMHTMTLGVVRTFTNAWLDSKYKNKGFYIGTKIGTLNSHLKLWRMPFNTERTIRGLDERKHWKSSEWRIWTFIAPVVLKGVLPGAYYRHFLKFVQSMFLLCSKRVYALDISKAEEYLKDFASGVQGLYGKSFCSFNVHLLTHAAMCVRNWGPLWNYSLFHFENFNGILMNYFKAAYRIETQISNKIIQNTHAVTLGGSMFNNRFALSFYQDLVGKRRRMLEKFTPVQPGCYVLGAAQLYPLSRDELDLLKALGDISPVVGCESYKRALVRNVHLSTETGITTKRCKCVVKYNSKLYIVKSILLATFASSLKVCYLVCFKLKCNDLVQNYPAYSVAKENKVKILRAESIDDSCFYCSISNANCIQQVVLLPNTAECE